jgi:predicted molibdopterin-dependent oxidoreductase YjgC
MDYRVVPTVCTYCGCGCGVGLEVLAGKVVRTIPIKTNPVNEGKLCIKGWNVHEFIHHSARLTEPLIRKNGSLQPVSWGEALDQVAKELSRIKESYGPDSIGFLVSAKCTNEDNYVAQKFARAVIGTNNVDHCARL